MTAVKQWWNTTGSWLTTIQQYDVLGNKVKVTDPGGHATNIDFTDRFSGMTGTNTFAYPTRVTEPSGFYVDTTYDFNTGVVKQTTDSLSRTTTKTYDIMNRELQTNFPNGGFTRYTYNDTALTTKKEIKVDSANNLGTVISYFDGLYREIKKETYDPDPAGNIFVETQYDANSRKREGVESAPLGRSPGLDAVCLRCFGPAGGHHGARQFHGCSTPTTGIKPR